MAVYTDEKILIFIILILISFLVACQNIDEQSNIPAQSDSNVENDQVVVGDTDNDIKEIGCGSCESSLTLPAVTSVGILGTAIVLKKTKRRFVRKNKR